MEDWTVPSHVPTDLVVDINLFDIPGGEIDPPTAWRNFQHKTPLAWSPRNGGHWIATCAEDIPKLFRDHEHLSSRQVVIPDPGNVMLPIQADPPMHRHYRAMINPLLTHEAVDARGPAIRALTVSLIEGFYQRGECEFIDEFALQLPLMIFLDMMGLPLEDLHYLRELVDVFSRDPDVNAKIKAAQDQEDYLNTWLDKRIAEPKDDGLTRVTQATVEGRPYTREEMLSTCVMLLQAGLDTVANLIGFIALYLARHPEQRDYIRDNHDKMPVIVQELLRRFPIANMARVVAKDWEYKGVLLKKGDAIMLPPSLFNLDPKNTDNADEVDLTRESAQHITFGSGRHTCAGALLARKEVSIFLEEWLSRIPDFETDPTRPPRTICMAANSISQLWLKWPVKDEAARQGKVAVTA